MKIAVITGASSGMGEEFAVQLEKAIPSLDEIWLLARREEELRRVAARLQKKIRIFPLDLTDPEALQRFQEVLMTEKPVIRMLVLAAGMGVIGDFAELPMEQSRACVSLNCTALTAITSICLPYLKKNSRILPIASSAAFLPQPHFAVYAATKSYVVRFFQALATELAEKGMIITLVCPGPVETPFFQQAERYFPMKAYKKQVMAPKEAVVRQALLDSLHRKRFSVYGVPMKALRLMSKWLPHSLLLKGMKQYEHIQERLVSGK